MLSIDLEMLSHGGPERRADRERVANHALDRAEGVARSLRNLSHRLHPASLRLTGVVSALGGLQRDLSTAETAITFTHEDAPVAIPQDVSLCLFRVAQEALHNAVKHSGAPAVSVHLKGGPDGLVLTIRDEGRGFDVDAARQGLGLNSMEERVAQMGGTLRIRSQRGGGTHLEVSTAADGHGGVASGLTLPLRVMPSRPSGSRASSAARAFRRAAGRGPSSSCSRARADVIDLDVVERQAVAAPAVRPRRRHHQLAAGADDDRTLDDVAQLADVARPAVALQFAHAVFNRLDVLPNAFATRRRSSHQPRCPRSVRAAVNLSGRR